MAQRGWVMILHLMLMCSWAVSCVHGIRFDVAASAKCIFDEIETNVLVPGDFSVGRLWSGGAYEKPLLCSIDYVSENEGLLSA